MAKYSPDFILWDAEEIITKEFKDKNNRVCDLHANPEFKELLDEAYQYGQEGKVHELVSDLFRKYARVIRDPNKI